jgi:serine/threonine-protein kinase RsbW
LGLKPCGLLVGLSPSFISFKKIHEDLPQRESLVLVYRRLNPASPGKIFLPPPHRDFILHLYAGLGMSPEVVEPVDEFPLTGYKPGVMTLTTYRTGGNAFIKLKEIGPETLAELKGTLKQLCQSRFEVIQLELDLSQSAAAHLVAHCESLGFFFAGILPGLNGAQTLILQYLNNVPLDYDKIQLHSPLAREILDYVKQSDPNRL